MCKKLNINSIIPILFIFFLSLLTSNFFSNSYYIDEYNIPTFCYPNFKNFKNISHSNNLIKKDKNEENIEININNSITLNLFKSYSFLSTLKYFIDLKQNCYPISNNRNFVKSLINYNCNNRSPPSFLS